MKSIIKKARKAILPSLLFASTLLPFSEMHAQIIDSNVRTLNQDVSQDLQLRRDVEGFFGKFTDKSEVEISKSYISYDPNRPSYVCQVNTWKDTKDTVKKFRLSIVEKSRTWYLLPAIHGRAWIIWNTIHNEPEYSEVYNSGKLVKIVDPYCSLVKKEFEGLDRSQTLNEFVQSQVQNNKNSLLEIVLRTTRQKERDLAKNITEAQVDERAYMRTLVYTDRMEYLTLAEAISNENKKNSIDEKDLYKRGNKIARIQNYYNEVLKKKGEAPFDYSILTRKEIRAWGHEFLKANHPDLIEKDL